MSARGTTGPEAQEPWAARSHVEQRCLSTQVSLHSRRGSIAAEKFQSPQGGSASWGAWSLGDSHGPGGRGVGADEARTATGRPFFGVSDQSVTRCRETNGVGAVSDSGF